LLKEFDKYCDVILKACPNIDTDIHPPFDKLEEGNKFSFD